MRERNDAEEWLHFLRKAELDAVSGVLPSKNLRILEIGGGDGFQARYLSELGHDVTSIDQYPKERVYFEVTKADVSKLEFPACSFDVVFSSHVIPHVKELGAAFGEMKRVLKDDGRIIHIVPTTSWSAVTNFWHYVLMPYNLYGFVKRKKQQTTNPDPGQNQNKSRSASGRILNFAFLHPLGENPSFVHELFYFSDRFWRKLFRENGFEVLQSGNGPYLYSGYGVFRMRFLNIRRSLAGSFAASRYYVMKKN